MIRSINKQTIAITFAVVGMIFSLAGFNPSSAEARGQCGNETSSWQGYYNGLKKKGVLNQAAKINQYAGYRPVDGSFKSWLRERVVVVDLAVSVTIENYGCNPDQVFGAGNKRLGKGWPVLVALPSKYAKSDVSTKPKKGYKRTKVRVKLVGQATCINPGKAVVYVYLWVKKSPKGQTRINITKMVEGGSYAGYFSFEVKYGKKTKTYRLKSGQTRSVVTVKRGSKVTVTETNLPSGWQVKGSTSQRKTAKGSSISYTFVNQVVVVPPPPFVCVSGTVVQTASGLACQSNSASVDNKAQVENDCKGPNQNSQQCVTTIIQNTTIIQVNANCSKVVITYSDGTTKVEYKDNNGNTVTENYCSVVTQPPPPTTVTFTATATATATASASATVTCPPGSTTATATASASASASSSASATSTVSQADADAKAYAAAHAGAYANAQANAYAKAQADAHVKCVPKTPEAPAPQVSCVWPAHVIKGDNVQVFCETSVSNRAAISLNITGGTPYAHISGVTTTNYRWDHTSTNPSLCPDGVVCWKATLWGDQVTPNGVYAHFTATASANGKSASTTGDVPIRPDDWPDVKTDAHNYTLPGV